MDGSGVVLITLMVPVVNFSAAPSDAEEAKARATIADSLSFIRSRSILIEDDATLMRFLMKFNVLGAKNA